MMISVDVGLIGKELPFNVALSILYRLDGLIPEEMLVLALEVLRLSILNEKSAPI